MMKNPSISRRASVGIGMVAAGLLLTLWPVTGRMAQRTETRRPPVYKLSIKDGDSKTSLKITAPRGRIASVSGTNERGTFNFKRVKKGERPRLVAGPSRVLKCARLIPDGGSHWTVCFTVAGDTGDPTAAFDYFLDLDYVKGESGGGSGGGGGGAPSNCWEDHKLQMSICDP